MKKTIYILLIIGTCIGLSQYFYNSEKQLATYQSPDGKYELIIKNGRGFFETTMPGDGGVGSLPVEVILKNSNGKVIGKSSDNSDCGLFYDSIEVLWYIEEGYVSYGRSRTINLKTGQVEC
ncbi:hypothetical protein M4I21_04975 [Cellulophaga sp. 20_2_10]|uniref:hypothetical protein n=1 Tax=Cellulophaga sp. 20_2_10 TaxID=2942476 RepID=UPI00201A6D0E|nr:hypothetical protein [Cellulophaga sp. 20_2_10]MCL5245150.1 hypothetical protein [Cellulophaga sp. 20_2_10]